MNRIITKKAALVFFASVATDATLRAQKPEAVNGILLTEPWQTISEDIIRNHIFSDDTYSWQFVVATLPNPIYTADAYRKRLQWHIRFRNRISPEKFL
jgi:hypothetical protein